MKTTFNTAPNTFEELRLKYDNILERLKRFPFTDREMVDNCYRQFCEDFIIVAAKTGELKEPYTTLAKDITQTFAKVFGQP